MPRDKDFGEALGEFIQKQHEDHARMLIEGAPADYAKYREVVGYVKALSDISTAAKKILRGEKVSSDGNEDQSQGVNYDVGVTE